MRRNLRPILTQLTLTMNELTQDVLMQLAKARETIIEQISDLEKALCGPALDGTPWLLIRTTGIVDMVYGNWPQIDTGTITQGWLSLLGTPHHLCGALMMSARDVQRHIDDLRARGSVARRMHVREFQAVRLGQLRRAAALYDEMLVSIKTDIAISN